MYDWVSGLWFKQMNMSGWVFNRIDTRLKDLWHNETHLQFQWNPEAAGPGNEGIFSHALDTHYGAPEITYKGFHYHFDWEVFNGLGGGENPGSQLPASDRDPSQFYDSTAATEAEAFTALMRLRSQWYKLGPPYQNLPAGHGAILVPFGDDMKFQNANKQYSNMDRLMAEINANASYGVNVRYGTLSEYFATINSNSKDWPTFTSDFFPLGTNNNVYTSQIQPTKDGDTEYWSGTFSTRPLMKGLVAAANGAKQTSEIAASIACALASPGSKSMALCKATPNADMMTARDVTAVLQHHDNIPGTSSPEAALNLDVRLRASIAASTQVMALATSAATDAIPVSEAMVINTSAATNATTLVLWNSLAQVREEYIEIPLEGCSAPSLEVTELNGKGTTTVVPSVIVPCLPALAYNDTHFKRRATVVFKAMIPPLSAATFTITTLPTAQKSLAAAWACQTPSASTPGNVTLASDSLSVVMSKQTGRTVGIQVDGVTWNVEQQHVQYHSSTVRDFLARDWSCVCRLFAAGLVLRVPDARLTFLVVLFPLLGVCLH